MQIGVVTRVDSPMLGGGDGVISTICSLYLGILFILHFVVLDVRFRWISGKSNGKVMKAIVICNEGVKFLLL